MLEIEYKCPHCGKTLINDFVEDVLRDGDDFVVSCIYCKKDAIIWIYFTANKLEKYE